MEKDHQTPGHHILSGVHTLFLLIGCVYFLFFRLGSYGFFETTDARYAEISYEMAKTGDFITPRLNYIKHFHKPPFTYWITCLGYYIFGYNEWGARFFTGIAGLLVLVITLLLSISMFDIETGILSGLILVSMIGFIAVTHVVSTDVYLLASIVLSIYLLWQWENRNISPLWLWAVLGVSSLIKGPVGPFLVGTIAIAYLILSGEIKRIKELQIKKGILIFSLIASPWYIIVCLKNKGLLSYFLHVQLLSRLKSGTMGHPHPWYYYLYTFPLLVFPWTLYLIPALGSRLFHLDKKGLLLMLWAILPIILFSLMKTKLPFYIIPSLPPLAILLANWWSRVKEDRLLDIIDRLMWAFIIILVIISFGIAASIIPLPRQLSEWQDIKSIWLMEGLVLCGLAALGYIALKRRKVILNFYILVTLVASISIPLFFYAERLPLNIYASLGKEVKSLARPKDMIAQYKCYLRSLPFYVERRVVLVGIKEETQFEDNMGYHEFLLTQKRFFKKWAEGKRIFCVVNKNRLPEFKGDYFLVTEKRKYALITNRSVPKSLSGFKK